MVISSLRWHDHDRDSTCFTLINFCYDHIAFCLEIQPMYQDEDVGSSRGWGGKTKKSTQMLVNECMALTSPRQQARKVTEVTLNWDWATEHLQDSCLWKSYHLWNLNCPLIGKQRMARWFLMASFLEFRRGQIRWLKGKTDYSMNLPALKANSLSKLHLFPFILISFFKGDFELGRRFLDQSLGFFWLSFWIVVFDKKTKGRKLVPGHLNFYFENPLLY